MERWGRLAFIHMPFRSNSSIPENTILTTLPTDCITVFEHTIFIVGQNGNGYVGILQDGKIKAVTAMVAGAYELIFCYRTMD